MYHALGTGEYDELACESPSAFAAILITEHALISKPAQHGTQR